jgi:hypothetical protein
VRPLAGRVLVGILLVAVLGFGVLNFAPASFVDVASRLPPEVREGFYDKDQLLKALAPLGCPDPAAFAPVVMDADCGRLWARYPGKYCEINGFECHGVKFMCGSDWTGEVCKKAN